MNNQHIDSRKIFEILIRENSHMLLTYLRAVVGAPHLVDEIYQETMLTAWQKIDDFDTQRSFGPWLRGIAKNHLFSHYRKSKKEMLVCNDEVLDYLEQKIHQLELQTGDTWKEKISSLKYCIQQLPSKYRQAIEASYIEEQKSAVVALQLAVSTEALKKRLQRAKRVLFACLNKKTLFED